MNNNIDKLYFLVHDDEVVVVESNVSAFYRAIKAKEIDIGMGLTSLRNELKDNLRFYIPKRSKQGRDYYIQKYLNET